jgi:hypothetical protein
VVEVLPAAAVAAVPIEAVVAVAAALLIADSAEAISAAPPIIQIAVAVLLEAVAEAVVVSDLKAAIEPLLNRIASPEYSSLTPKEICL